jgi:hypothetical protein
MTLEQALNQCMGKCTVSPARTSSVAVTLDAYPQCRGEGASKAAALRDVRAQYDFIQDCRAAWAIDDLLLREASAPTNLDIEVLGSLGCNSGDSIARPSHKSSEPAQTIG